MSFFSFLQGSVSFFLDGGCASFDFSSWVRFFLFSVAIDVISSFFFLLLCRKRMNSWLLRFLHFFFLRRPLFSSFF